MGRIPNGEGIIAAGPIANSFGNTQLATPFKIDSMDAVKSVTASLAKIFNLENPVLLGFHLFGEEEV